MFIDDILFSKIDKKILRYVRKCGISSVINYHYV